MYKLKTMLLSFALLAIVGTALSFKARFGLQWYCTAPTNGRTPGFNNICTVVAGQPGEMQFCPNITYMTTVDQQHGNMGVWCTTPSKDFGGGVIGCEDIWGLNTVRCEASAFLYTD